MKPEELLRRLRAGHTANVPFDDFCRLVERFGFELHHITGSHRTYGRPGILRLVNIQPLDGEVKGYQAKQFIKLVDRYGLQLQGRDD